MSPRLVVMKAAPAVCEAARINSGAIVDWHRQRVIVVRPPMLATFNVIGRSSSVGNANACVHELAELEDSWVSAMVIVPMRSDSPIALLIGVHADDATTATTAAMMMRRRGLDVCTF